MAAQGSYLPCEPYICQTFLCKSHWDFNYQTQQVISEPACLNQTQGIMEQPCLNMVDSRNISVVTGKPQIEKDTSKCNSNDKSIPSLFPYSLDS